MILIFPPSNHPREPSGVKYDDLLDAWVIDVNTIRGILPDPKGSATDLSSGGAHGRASTAPSACAVPPVTRALVSLRRRLQKGHLVCWSKHGEATKQAPSGHLQLRWRRRRISVARKPATAATAGRRYRQASQRDRDQKLREAICYCKMTMGMISGE